MPKRRFFYLFTCLFVSTLTLSFAANKVADKQRGVSWVAGPPVSEKDFDRLLRNKINWIVQTPFGWQKKYNSPELRLATGGVYWGETDAGIEATARIAKKLGVKTLLKPHIWLNSSTGGKWRGEIKMDSDADWQLWFANYRKFILHYARLAQTNGIEALSVGTELHITAVQREQDWRALIRDVRKVFKGKLTYSANWYLEFQEIQFWDMLDFIGVQGYFPLTKKENPTVQELKDGWVPHYNDIRRLSERYHKPVVFTEIGYKSTADTAIEPWEWPHRSAREASEMDLRTQANCYEAFFEIFWKEEWCAGAYFWKWFPKLSHRDTYRGRDFTPQLKPAETVLAKWYSGSSN